MAISRAMRLTKLREVMKNTNYVSEVLQAYIIPVGDAHQSEYIAPHHQRLEYVSGFSGSAGTAIVTEKLAALWTDGRYWSQAEKELNDEWTLMKDSLPKTPSQTKWLTDVLPVNGCVGVDPLLMNFNSFKTMSNALKLEGHTLVPVSTNLIDKIWFDQPIPVTANVNVLDLKYTGKTWEDKILSIREEMAKHKVSVLIVTALDEVAWLFNLRGSDIPYCPVFFSYAVVTLNSINLFVDKSKLTQSALRSLCVEMSLRVSVHPYENILEFLQSMLVSENEGKFWISPLSSNALVSMLPEDKRHLKASPITEAKALKNEAELSGAKNAHIKDAVALCEYFAWLTSVVGKEEVTEIAAAEKLTYFRSLQKNFVSLSFETISASGPNGAIIHYKPRPETERTLTTQDLYLCDSGGQYLDGTTDVTRTLHFGVPTSFQKMCYTRVLKGQIALSSAKFPKFTKGNTIDAIARKPLWDHGLDYAHGTGHGVGAFLNVHEGPILISYYQNPYDPGLQPGMIMSIEPGYYENEVFGIRLENLAFIKEIKTTYKKEKVFLTFEPLTLVPYQTSLIEASLLTAEEVEWINNYNLTCREVIGSILSAEGKTEAFQYLVKETFPI